MSDKLVTEAFIHDGSGFHFVSGTRYSQERTAATTFCSSEIEIESTDEYIHVPLDLLDRTGACWDCERKLSLINDDRFPSSHEYTGEYRFIIRGVIRTGEHRGEIEVEVIPADSVEQAKERFEQLYRAAEEVKYYRISKAEEGLNFETIYDEREENPYPPE